MISRDEYVQKLKSQIDQWNAEAAKWEAKAKQAQAGMQADYAKQLEQYRGRRDAALAELRRLQSASADAWKDMMRGADAAMKSMQEAFDKARSKYEKK
jgi:lipid II:glycine glycyltransferase (peptidoglycan interpeptide bridge formation enzyme)